MAATSYGGGFSVSGMTVADMVARPVAGDAADADADAVADNISS